MFETERTVLKPISRDDAPDFMRIRMSNEVTRFQGTRFESIEDTEKHIETYNFNNPEEVGLWKQLGIYLKTTDKLIGDIGFNQFEERQAEIGYTIAPSYHNHGFATEVVTKLIFYLFVQKNFHRVVATTDPRNLASIQVVKKLGFRQEGHFVKSFFLNGEWTDDLKFALLKSEYLS